MTTPGSRAIKRLDAFQQRHRVVGLPLSVVYKYADDAGGNLAAQMTYYGFVALFPLLLLASTILGFVLAGHPDLERQVLASALTQLPVVGHDIRTPAAIGGGLGGLVVGVLGAVYGAMGLGQAVQNASDTAWTRPRNRRANPFKTRGKSLVLLAVIGGDVLGTGALAGFVGASGILGAWSRLAVLAGSVVIHVAAFSFVFRFSTSRPLSWRQVRPGAAVAAVAWLLLQYVGVAYVGHVVHGTSATNSVFAVVLGLLAFIYLTCVVLMLCMELNVVLVDHLHPRTLLTPFTDHVVLTPGDKKSYTDLAKAQRLKGFEDVDVSFRRSPAEPPDEPDR